MKEKALALAPLPFFGKRGRKSNLNRTKLFLSKSGGRRRRRRRKSRFTPHPPFLSLFVSHQKSFLFPPSPPGRKRAAAEEEDSISSPSFFGGKEL